MRTYLDFEKPVADLDTKVDELRQVASSEDAIPIGDELTRLEVEANLVIHIRHEDDAPPEHLHFDCFDANNNEIRVLPQPAPPPRRGR